MKCVIIAIILQYHKMSRSEQQELRQLLNGFAGENILPLTFSVCADKVAELD